MLVSLVDIRGYLTSPEELFGGGIKPFLLLVYTKADTLGESNLNQFCDEQMKDARQAIAQFLRDLDWRIVAVNNKTTTPAEKRRNQEIIIAMVDKLKDQNKNAVYTNEMFHEAAEKRRELTEKGKGKGWNAQVMEAVDAVIEANPDIYKDNKKLMEYVLKHLEQEQKDIEIKLNEAKQIKEERQEENNETTTKENLEDEQNEAHNKPGHEKEKQLLKQTQDKEYITKAYGKNGELTQELKGGTTPLKPLVEKGELTKDETKERQEKDVPEYENKTKLGSENDEKEMRKNLEEALEREREEKRMILEKQAHERERAMKEREELIKENESRLRLSREALDNAKTTTQITEIAKEHDNIVTSMVGVVTSGFTKMLTTGVSSVLNYGKSWFGY